MYYYKQNQNRIGNGQKVEADKAQVFWGRFAYHRQKAYCIMGVPCDSHKGQTKKINFKKKKELNRSSNVKKAETDTKAIKRT